MLLPKFPGALNSERSPRVVAVAKQVLHTSTIQYILTAAKLLARNPQRPVSPCPEIMSRVANTGFCLASRVRSHSIAAKDCNADSKPGPVSKSSLAALPNSRMVRLQPASTRMCCARPQCQISSVQTFMGCTKGLRCYTRSTDVFGTSSRSTNHVDTLKVDPKCTAL